MTKIGLLYFFPGIQVLQLHDGIFLSQPKYVLVLLKIFKMDDYKSYATPFQSGAKLTKECDSSKFNDTLYRQLVGSLIYLTHGQVDILFFVSVVS